MIATRILIANQQLLGKAIAKLLEGEFLVLGVAASPAEAVAWAAEQFPDILLLDSGFLHEAGTAVLHCIRSRAPRVKLVVLAEQSDRFAFGGAVQFGAAGFVAKQQSPEELLAALRTVARGQRYTCPQMRDELPWARTLHSKGADRALTGRQREVLQFVAGGKTNKEIARLLGISPKTAEFHKAAVSNALGLRTTAELTRFAVGSGLAAAL